MRQTGIIVPIINNHYQNKVLMARTKSDLEYIRKIYGVPAHIGRTISFQGNIGEITGTNGCRLKIRLDERPYGDLIVHPLWMMDYYVIQG